MPMLFLVRGETINWHDDEEALMEELFDGIWILFTRSHKGDYIAKEVDYCLNVSDTIRVWKAGYDFETDQYMFVVNESVCLYFHDMVAYVRDLMKDGSDEAVSY